MNETIGALTVYFDSPFWVGVFERIEDGTMNRCKIKGYVETAYPRREVVW